MFIIILKLNYYNKISTHSTKVVLFSVTLCNLKVEIYVDQEIGYLASITS